MINLFWGFQNVIWSNSNTFKPIILCVKHPFVTKQKSIKKNQWRAKSCEKKGFFRNQVKCAMLWLLPFLFRSISLSTSSVQKYSRNIRYTTLRGIQKREGTWEQTAYKIPTRLTNLIIDLKFGDFASIRSVIGQQNRRYPLNQSDAKRKLIVTWSPAFSRVFDSLPVFLLSAHWLMMK